MSTDDELLDELRRIAAAVDPVPELVDETARAAFTMRRLDDELAELLQDTDLADRAAVRGSGPRLLSYAAGEVSLELHLDEVGGRLTLRGLAVGATGEVELESRDAGQSFTI